MTILALVTGSVAAVAGFVGDLIVSFVASREYVAAIAIFLAVIGGVVMLGYLLAPLLERQLQRFVGREDKESLDGR